VIGMRSRKHNRNRINDRNFMSETTKAQKS